MPGYSSAAAELIMAPVGVKVALDHRILATELGQGPWGPTPLYLGALAVLYGTAAAQVSREIKYLAAKLAIMQEARSRGKVKTEKSDESSHPAEILTKPLQREKFVLKRRRLLKLRAVLPAKLSFSATTATGSGGAEGEADRARRAPSDPAPGTWGRALGRLLGRGRG